MSGPLAGCKVLDLSWGVAGPFATMFMADYGADVIRVEPPGGDPYRDLLPAYRVWQRGKQSLTLNLKTDSDRRVSPSPAGRRRRTDRKLRAGCD